MYPQLETEAEALEKATARALLPGATSKPASEAGKAPRTNKWKRRLHRHIPVFQWLPLYTTEWGINDFIAGITLGLTIIPESMACALLAGLPARYGLCSAFIGPLIYLVFGSIDKVIIGPTSLVALVSVQFTVGRPIEFAFLLTFLSGIVQIIMGTMRMGFIFEFISMPVIKAFSSATAILVIESQLKVLLGIKYLVAGLINSVGMLSSRIEESNIADFIMGVCAIVFLLLLELLDRVANNEKRNKVLRICCRYLSTSRNTLIVLIAAIVSFIWIQKYGQVPYALSKNALATLPNFTVPSFNIETPERSYSIWEVVKELNIGIIVIPIVGILTNISIGKLTPKGLVDTNQELLTVGLCNMFGSCVQAMPSSGAFTRYAISTACGLRTPMANLYLGIIVLLALSYLSPYFNYIPEATLAAILICSIFTLLDFKLPMRLWRDSKRDFATWLLCFCVSVLFGVEVGLFVSIVVTALHLLFLWARPEIRVKIEQLDEMRYIRVTPGNGIYFPAINYLRERVLKACEQADFRITVVIDGQRISGMDYTAAQGVSKLSSDLCRQADASSSTLLILFRFPEHLQRLIDHTDNLVFCESENKVKEFLTQESLRNGYINLKEHIRASIDLGYKIDID
ncbi:sodium-independent sulfate anion transporter [Drosophila santomea]|uniref:sodium-independent sulfate anion transporter n=1 Tax=Drosophila santomea TaxID=129105 RepID=UPI00195317B8|nr:sodium-independent sulfate anion transporter [Drosophila santomea]XP_039494455.1 sodium-independent sulfate anion transporter [Drosophila santomea]XP_039494456.1 sodium-independent sulfate anion transporter [Drosophila santomea]